jgi:FdhE protein
MSSQQEKWLEQHPYLAPIGKLVRTLQAAAAGAPAAAAPRLEAYARDAANGVPLLLSTDAAFDVATPGGEALARLVEGAAGATLPERLGQELGAIRERFRHEAGAPRAAIEWLVLGGEAAAPAPPSPGLLRFLGWTALRPVLAPSVALHARWREERREETPWTKGYCPTCGALPALGQLVEEGVGRKRSLACGCCGDVWGWRRVGCPFCGNEAGDRLDALEVEAGEPFRLDHCQECNGYVKTYTGRGAEDLYLADWTTLHLDALAKDRGYERKGASLYEL